MSTALLLSLMLSCSLGLAVAQHPCCAPAGRVDLGGCTMAKCNAALKLDNHGSLVELLDGCRSETNNFTLVSDMMQCVVPMMDRAKYDALVFEREASEADLMSANVAAMVLGYGCVASAHSRACDALTQLLFPSTGDHVFGLMAQNFTEGEVTAGLNINQAIQQCIASELESFGESEWNKGMAQCSAAGTDSKPASIAGLVTPTTGVTCSSCVPSSQRELPFCAQFFTSNVTTRYGSRCDKSLISDRIAQSYHDQWMRTNVATFGDSVTHTISNFNSNPDCNAFLKEVSCRTSLGVCSSTTSVHRMCKSQCEAAMNIHCQASAAAATSVCSAIGATRTDSSCPVSTTSPPTTAAPTVTPVTNFTLVTSTSVGTMYNVTFCSSKSGQDASLLMTVLTSVLSKTCPPKSPHCELVDYSNFTTSDPKCSFRVEAVMTTQASSSFSSQQFTASLSKQTAVPEASFTVSATSFPLKVIAESGQGSGQSTLIASSAVLLFAGLFARTLI
eukprot:scpid63720/ scgid33103/ 